MQTVPKKGCPIQRVSGGRLESRPCSTLQVELNPFPIHTQTASAHQTQTSRVAFTQKRCFCNSHKASSGLVTTLGLQLERGRSRSQTGHDEEEKVRVEPSSTP